MTGELNHDPEFERWPPAGTLTVAEWAMPGWGATIWRGICNKCPHCAKSSIFAGFLRVVPKCAVCGAPLGDMPADDAPPYIAMLVALHFLGLFVVVIFHFHYLPGIFASIVYLVLLAGICCVALRMAKGAVIGILLKLGLKRAALNV